MEIRPIELVPLMAIAVDVLPVVDLGGGRRYIPFRGGTFEGRDGLRGTIGAGGVDWQQVRPDGTLEIDAHDALHTDDGEIIEIRSTGLRAAPPEVLARMAAGDPVEPDEYYFRTHIRFTTGSARLAWLNDRIGVSTGRRERDVVHIDVHEVS